METLGEDADVEALLTDATVVRAHRHAAGARKKAENKPSADHGAA